MIKLRIKYMDGTNWAEPYTEGHEKAGLAFVTVCDSWWADYQEHREASREWQKKLSYLSNIQYAKDHSDDEWVQSFVHGGSDD